MVCKTEIKEAIFLPGILSPMCPNCLLECPHYLFDPNFANHVCERCGEEMSKPKMLPAKKLLIDDNTCVKRCPHCQKELSQLCNFQDTASFKCPHCHGLFFVIVLEHQANCCRFTGLVRKNPIHEKEPHMITNIEKQRIFYSPFKFYDEDDIRCPHCHLELSAVFEVTTVEFDVTPGLKIKDDFTTLIKEVDHYFCSHCQKPLQLDNELFASPLQEGKIEKLILQNKTFKQAYPKRKTNMAGGSIRIIRTGYYRDEYSREDDRYYDFLVCPHCHNSMQELQADVDEDYIYECDECGGLVAPIGYSCTLEGYNGCTKD